MMNKTQVVVLCAFLFLAGACEDDPFVIINGIPPTPPPNAAPRATLVQLPDSIFLTIGSSAIIMDVMALFYDGDPLRIDAESSNIDAVVVHVWRRTATPGQPVHPVYDRTANQISIIGVGEGEAVVTLTVTEPQFDPSDPTPARDQPSGRSASRQMHVTVKESGT